MLTLYGQVMSRAQRTLWLLEELEVPFEHVKTNQNAGETRTEEFLAINPNGHVPVIPMAILCSGRQWRLTGTLPLNTARVACGQVITTSSR